jgi:hypothetical protein
MLPALHFFPSSKFWKKRCSTTINYSVPKETSTMKLAILSTAAALVTLSSTNAFVPSKVQRNGVSCNVATETEDDVSTRTGKPTGTSFLPAETVERAKTGSPIEKIKMAKDATSAWVDVYEYARKIREGEMTWEDVEKADLDSVSLTILTTLSAFFVLNFASHHIP